jgi:hypothetical protein
MRAILEVTSGPDKGRRVRVLEEQLRKIGRSDWADFACRGDERMSRVHFQIKSETDGCYLRDLDSRNGTYVNGQRVTEPVQLHEGDQISAGMTRFLVHVPGEPPRDVDTFPMTRPVDLAEQDASPRHAPPDGQTLTYTSEICEGSGLSLFRGGKFGDDGQPSSPAHVVGLLGQQIPLYLIVHFAKAEFESPPEVPDAVPLFDWVEDEALPSCPDSTGQPPARGTGEGILGYCWPGVLSQLLTFRSEEFVGRLLEGIDAALLEVPDLPRSWQVFAPPDFSETLAKIGFRERPEEKPQEPSEEQPEEPQNEPP